MPHNQYICCTLFYPKNKNWSKILMTSFVFLKYNIKKKHQKNKHWPENFEMFMWKVNIDQSEKAPWY